MMTSPTIDRHIPEIPHVPAEAEPLSVEEAQAERTDLLERLRSIDAQLGQGYRIDPTTTRRLNQKDYADWRRRALDARRHIELRYRFLKTWLRESEVAKARRNQARHGDELIDSAFEVARVIKLTSPLVGAAVAFVNDETPETRRELTDAVNDYLDLGGQL